MTNDSEILHNLIQEIENINSQDMGNTAKVFFISKEIGKVKNLMRNYQRVEAELKILEDLRINIEKELERSTDPLYAPSQLENIYNLIVETY